MAKHQTGVSSHRRSRKKVRTMRHGNELRHSWRGILYLGKGSEKHWHFQLPKCFPWGRPENRVAKQDENRQDEGGAGWGREILAGPLPTLAAPLPLSR